MKKPPKSKSTIKFETRPVGDLIPYARNARTHSAEQVAQIAASIQEFGFVNPVIINTENVLIAGHCRVMAAGKLKMQEIPCVVVGGLTKAQQRALVLADNRLALSAGWDMEMLSLELGELSEAGYDLALTGFSEGEISDMLKNAAALDEMPGLSDADKPEIQQMTFTLHDTQAEAVLRALEVAKGMGEYGDTGNENSNGNALARVCEMFVGNHGNG